MTSTDAQEFAVRPLRSDDSQGVLSVLNEAFGRRATMDWFRWKHQNAPWGPSGGWVATDQNKQIVGVRLITPWALTAGESPVPITRAMDGAIAPNAQRRGLFSRLVSAEMELMASGARDTRLLYSTSVPASREAYRKLGWEIRDIPHMASMVAPAPSRAVKLEWDDALDQGALPDGPLGSSAWTVDSLRWRIDRQSGYEYRTVRLRESDISHGLILRLARLMGVRTVVVVFSWGPETQVKALIRAAATRLGAPLALAVGNRVYGLRRQVGTSTVSAWSGLSSSSSQTYSVGNLHLEFADVEGVM